MITIRPKIILQFAKRATYDKNLKVFNQHIGVITKALIIIYVFLYPQKSCCVSMQITWSSYLPIKMRYPMQKPNYEIVILKSTKAFPTLP
jgi:hypothetical protein